MERFLSLLQGHSVNREQEDRVVWKGENKGAFSVKGLYSVLGTDCTISVEPLDSFKSEFLHLGGSLGKSLTLD